jgi:hypothetical protein
MTIDLRGTGQKGCFLIHNRVAARMSWKKFDDAVCCETSGWVGNDSWQTRGKCGTEPFSGECYFSNLYGRVVNARMGTL